MAVIKASEFEAMSYMWPYAPSDRCFFCGEHLTGDRWIVWQGNDEKGQQIWLHNACAKRLADHLNIDFAKK